MCDRGPAQRRSSAPLYGTATPAATSGVPPIIGPDYILGLTKRWELRRLAQVLAQVSELFWHNFLMVS